jgi:hypothetical protein
MNADSDLTLICRQCGREFIFTKAEQEFYQEKGFAQPRRCKQCRSTKTLPLVSPVCSKCGSRLEEGGPMYCASCLKDAQLEFELKARGLQRKLDDADAKLSAIEVEKALLADEAEVKLEEAETEKAQLAEEAGTRLSIVESEKARLEVLLQQKEQVVADLQGQLKDTGLELEQVLKYRTALDWIEPVLKSFKEKLEVLEHNQDSISQVVLQLAQKFGESHENGSLLEIFRRLFRPHRNSTASNR